MWGTLPSRPGPSLRDRFIPTHVGNTSPDPATHGQFAVHPHACGEHQRAVIAQHAADGSSPRMWGTHEHACKNIQIRRFIPTHVGNTWYPGLRASAPPVHPHTRGEHDRRLDLSKRRLGSSPRTWGTLGRSREGDALRRFIPTHVGNTNSLLSRRLPSAGSSPRTWGTLFDGPPERNEPRFIPTHVGNTSNWPSTSYRPTVHPHARGEHTGQLPPVGNVIGSSPRTWGTPLGALGLGQAGKVHPHARGEHLSSSSGFSCQHGSSPRTWGTHLPYSIVFKEEKTPRKIYRLILYSVVRSRGWNATNCSPSNNTGCRRLTPRVWNS